jgi:hypothetical protein
MIFFWIFFEIFIFQKLYQEFEKYIWFIFVGIGDLATSFRMVEIEFNLT